MEHAEDAFKDFKMGSGPKNSFVNDHVGNDVQTKMVYLLIDDVTCE